MIEILNWNTALTENHKNYKSIFSCIEDFLNKENAIVVLQQIPIKDPNDKWKPHKLFLNLQNRIQKHLGCRIFVNDEYNSGFVYMGTVIITNIKDIEQVADNYYPKNKKTNRECAISVKLASKELVILGLHAENGEKNKNYLESISGDADVILGDFNAGDYEESENRDLFKEILKEHVCICNMPTKRVMSKGLLIRKTCIDHVFVRRKNVTACFDMKVHEDNELSDHYPISFKINM